ncbi:hypothetical protein DSO57_1026741 [Entomophthora muscae]|uniref:Uncharacterized protein n=1 Tax=Entomophthora muscae TaxID=34485 RepID=A0ACC2RGN0_9FUNG|nr:hypothetical protein DSO57_1026741 [Entomophthora muscae]
MFSLSSVVENKGSTARDHLANERTFLAWLRTSLSLTMLGVAFTQLAKLGPNEGLIKAAVIGALFCALGIIFAIAGIYRYFANQYYLKKGKFLPSRFLILTGSGLVSSLTIVVILVILWSDAIF